MLFSPDPNATLSGMFPPAAGRPAGYNYWQGNQLIRPPLPSVPRRLVPEPPHVASELFTPEGQYGQPNDNGGSGSNTVGGSPTSTAAAPGGFSSTSGQANRASSPSVSSGPSYATVGGVGGALLGAATNLPGVGMIGSGIGGYLDAQRANADLAAIGHPDRSVDPGKAAVASIAGIGPFSLAPGWTTAGQMTNMDIGLSPRGVAELADFARNDKGYGLTGFDSLDMDAAYGLNLASMSPLSAAMSPMGLLGFSNYGPDITSLGSPGLGGYGNLGTEHSYGFVDGNLVGNFTGNEGRDSPGGATGAMGGHGGGGGEGFGGSDPDGNGNWAKGGPVPTVRRDTVPGPDDQYITVKSGEYVIRPEAVAHYGRGLLDALNSGRIPRGLMQDWPRL